MYSSSDFCNYFNGNFILFLFSNHYKTINNTLKKNHANELEIIDPLDFNITNEYKRIKDDLKKTLKFSKEFIIMYIMHLFSVFARTFITLIDINDEWPSFIYVYIWLSIRLCPVAIPVIYPMFHFSIRQSYLNLFRIIFKRKKQKEKLILRVIYVKRNEVLNLYKK